MFLPVRDIHLNTLFAKMMSSLGTVVSIYAIVNLHFAICIFPLQQQLLLLMHFCLRMKTFLRHHFLFNFKIVAHLQNLHNYFYDRYIGYGICKNVVPLKHNTFYSKYATENNSIVYQLSDMQYMNNASQFPSLTQFQAILITVFEVMKFFLFDISQKEI